MMKKANKMYLFFVLDAIAQMEALYFVPTTKRNGVGHKRMLGKKMSAEDNAEAWNRVCDFHSGSWRGVSRRVKVDGVLRRAQLENDARRYVSTCEALEKIPSLRDSIFWDGEKESTEVRIGHDFSCDLDASYSMDFHDKNSNGHQFCSELTFALGNNERVKLIIGYDALNYLSDITVLDEVRLGLTDETSVGARRTTERTDLWSLAGEWQGDATVRRRYGELAVAKHDVSINTDGDRVHRSVTIADISGTTVHQADALGVVVPSPSDEIDLVVFDSGSALVHLQFAGIYALAPLSIGAASFHVEAGLIVDEFPDIPNAQFPISIRTTTDNTGENTFASKSNDDNQQEPPRIIGLDSIQGDGSSEKSRKITDKQPTVRHLARTIRLYDSEGQLASVTSSYHRRGGQ